MKVVKINDEETKLTKRQQQKVAILKLTDNGKYIEGVGIKDNEFFLLTEGDDDEQYLAHMYSNKPTKRLSKDDVVRLVLTMMKEKEIATEKARLQGKEPPLW
jgi:hypothetical protein